MTEDQYSRLRIAASSSGVRIAEKSTTGACAPAIRLSTRGSARGYLSLGSGGIGLGHGYLERIQFPLCREGGQCPV